MIEFKVIDDGGVLALTKFTRALNDYSPLFRKLQIGRGLSQAFKSQGSALGKQWSRRKPDPTHQRRNKLMQKTGTLQRALSKPKGQFNKLSATWVVSNGYGPFLHFGTNDTKARVLVGWSAMMKDEYQRELDAYANAMARKVGL